MTEKKSYEIHNQIYTINAEDYVHENLQKFLDLENNNETKQFIAAYISLLREKKELEEEIETIINKISRY